MQPCTHMSWTHTCARTPSNTHPHTRTHTVSTYKSAAVVVTHCLCITKGFKKWVWFNNDVFDVLYTASSAWYFGNILHNVFSCHCFSCTRLTTETQNNILVSIWQRKMATYDDCGLFSVSMYFICELHSKISLNKFFGGS